MRKTYREEEEKENSERGKVVFFSNTFFEQKHKKENRLHPSPKCQRCRNRVYVIRDNHSFFGNDNDQCRSLIYLRN
jgi:hypothetical protein